MESVGKEHSRFRLWARKPDAGCHERLLAAATAGNFSSRDGRHSSLFRFPLSPLRQLKNLLLRPRRKFQLRYCEPQHVLNRAWDPGSIDRNYWLLRFAGTLDGLSQQGGNANSLADRVSRRARIRALSHLHRRIRSGGLVRPLPVVAGVDILRLRTLIAAGAEEPRVMPKDSLLLLLLL